MRAQISVDFIIASIAVMIMFSLIFNLYAEKNRGINTIMASLEAERIGEKLAWGINDVARAGDGAKTDIIIPETILGEGYYAYVEGRWVDVTWHHGGVENHLSFPLMTSNTKKGMIEPGSHLTIMNIGGKIHVS
ncbi:MAG: hypothetical protein ABIG39_02775 [Candidatus Micrarchaeota archaeon]